MHVLNSKGKPVTLSSREAALAKSLQNEIRGKVRNLGIKGPSGYNIDVTVLTKILKSVIDTKFFTVAPADFIPMPTGEGAWHEFLTTYKATSNGESFISGVADVGNTRIDQIDVGLDSTSIKTYKWIKAIEWTLFDLNTAALAGNWQIIEARENARKKNWDLGIQEIAFLGARELKGCNGLLTLKVTPNTEAITSPVSKYTPEQLNNFASDLITEYRKYTLKTAYPNTFVMPESDYLGLAKSSSPQFPLKSALTFLLECFKEATRDQNFKILPLAYCEPQFSMGLLSKYRYVLYRNDMDSLRMDVPIPYTNTVANTIEGFSFKNTAYGQFTGVQLYRPELMYFDRPAT